MTEKAESWVRGEAEMRQETEGRWGRAPNAGRNWGRWGRDRRARTHVRVCVCLSPAVPGEDVNTVLQVSSPSRAVGLGSTWRTRSGPQEGGGRGSVLLQTPFWWAQAAQEGLGTSSGWSPHAFGRR